MEMIVDRSSAVLDVESDVRLCSIKVCVLNYLTLIMYIDCHPVQRYSMVFTSMNVCHVKFIISRSARVIRTHFYIAVSS